MTISTNNCTLDAILTLIGPDTKVEGSFRGDISSVSPLSALKPNSLSFMTGGGAKVTTWLSTAHHCVILAPKAVSISEDVFLQNCFIRVDNPKLTFIRILKAFFEKKRPSGIHPTAQIHSSVFVGKSVYVGAYCVIEEDCRLEEGCILEANVTLYRATKVGSHTHIHAGACIGKEGLGHVPTESGEWINFPHLGGVTLGQNCMIGCCVTIDRGTLSDTRLGNGVLVDSHSHVGHNTQIGDHTLVAGGTIISGSVTIGSHVYIGPQATLSDGISVGNRARISIGSTVIQSVPEGVTVTGYFAQDHRKYLKKMMDDQLKYFK